MTNIFFLDFLYKKKNSNTGREKIGPLVPVAKNSNNDNKMPKIKNFDLFESPDVIIYKAIKMGKFHVNNWA